MSKNLRSKLRFIQNGDFLEILAIFRNNRRRSIFTNKRRFKKSKNNKLEMSANLGSPNAEDGDEPALEPVNGMVFPPFMPRADKPGKKTNQLKYLGDVVIKVNSDFLSKLIR